MLFHRSLLPTDFIKTSHRKGSTSNLITFFAESSYVAYCSIIRSVLEYASPVWAGLTQYLSDQIESVQKRALKIIFPFMSYEDALKKSGLINLCQRREDACVTFLKRSYYSSDLLRNLVPRCQFSRPYALRAGRTVSVPTSSRSIRFGNFCTIKYQNHV